MSSNKLSGIWLWLACCLAGAALADDAYIYPESVYSGDIVDLVIEYDSRFPALYALDDAPLEADFEVLDTRSRVFRVTENDKLCLSQFNADVAGRLSVLPPDAYRHTLLS